MLRLLFLLDTSAWRLLEFVCAYAISVLAHIILPYGNHMGDEGVSNAHNNYEIN